jgi:putative transposase
MTSPEFALSDLAARLAGTDASLATSLREIVAAALQELIEAELTSTIGAAPGERSPERTAQRNGHRPKLLWGTKIPTPWTSTTRSPAPAA